MSIFDVQPPAWLQNIARPADMSVAAKDIGIGLAAGIRAGQMAASKENQALPTDQQKTWLQEIPQALTEARLNQMDPLWKVKMAQQGALIKSRDAQASLALERANQMAHESELAINEMPQITQWWTSLKEHPDAPPPVVHSKAANQELQRLFGIQNQQERMKQQKQIADLQNTTRQQGIDAANYRAGVRSDTEMAKTEALIKSREKMSRERLNTMESIAAQNNLTRQAIAAEKAGKADPTQKDIVNKLKAIDKLTVKIEGLRAKWDSDPDNPQHGYDVAQAVRERTVLKQQLDALKALKPDAEPATPPGEPSEHEEAPDAPTPTPGKTSDIDGYKVTEH